MRTEEDFLEWLVGCRFYTGYCRHGQFGGYGHFIATCYDEDEHLGLLVDDLSGGDLEAIDAPDKIIKTAKWYSNHKNPEVAMSDIVSQMRNYYFLVLNKDSPTE